MAGKRILRRLAATLVVDLAGHGRMVAQYARAIVIGGVVVLVPQGRATAHGDASWIMDHPHHGWCCGPQDCFWLDPDEVRVDQDHYVVDRFAIRWPIIGAFRSADHRYWACYYMRGSSDQQVKCFFAPQPPAM